MLQNENRLFQRKEELDVVVHTYSQHTGSRGSRWVSCEFETSLVYIVNSKLHSETLAQINKREERKEREEERG